MSFFALTGQLTGINVGLDQLFLDPNNPRFVSASWRRVPEALWADEDVQERTIRHMVDEFGVDKLRMNMEINGYLPIDRVIVQEFATGQYIVLEGNRRICAAKLITDQTVDGAPVSPEVADSLKSIPVLVYTGTDQNAAWIFQGLRHIAGVEDWSAFNKAKLLVEQMEADGLSLQEVGRRFGLTPHGAGQWVRGFFAFKQAQESSDYIAEVDERSYPYFQEIFSRSSIPVREWLQWSEGDRTFKNVLGFNEFVSWLYPRKEDEESESGAGARGDFDRRVLARRDDVRELAKLISESPEYFNQFRQDGRLEHAVSAHLLRQMDRDAKSKSDPVKEVLDGVAECTRLLDNIPLKMMKDSALNAELNAALNDLREKIAFVQD